MLHQKIMSYQMLGDVGESLRVPPLSLRQNVCLESNCHAPPHIVPPPKPEGGNFWGVEYMGKGKESPL